MQEAPNFDNITSVEANFPIPCCGHPLVDYVRELREVALAAAEDFRGRHPGADLPMIVITVHNNNLFTLDTQTCACTGAAKGTTVDVIWFHDLVHDHDQVEA